MTDHRAPGWRVDVQDRPAGPQLPPRRDTTPIAALSAPTVQPPEHFEVRVVRDGPLVPARLWWCDHEPGVPENKLDRGMLSVFQRADIADVEVPPEQLVERTWAPATHWKYARPIPKDEYDHLVARLRWAERHRPDEPGLRPRRAVQPAQLALPNFDRENAI